MKKCTFFIIPMMIFCTNFVVGQENTAGNAYSRVSLTVVYIDDPSPDETMNSGIRQSITNFHQNNSIVPGKFDDHTVSPRVETIDLSNYSLIASPDDKAKIGTAIEQSPLARNMVAKWFNRSADGTFNMDLIKSRGRYSASDNDALTAYANQRQDKVLEDMGEKLLQKSFLLLLNYSDIKPYYNNEKKLESYSGNVRGYLYRLVWDEETSAKFYNELWINDTDDAAIKTQKKALFESTPYKVVAVTTVNSSGSQSTNVMGETLSESATLELLYKKLSEGVIEKLEFSVSDFQVKMNLVSSKPLAATIGLKEGLYVDQRYFVMEKTYDSKNNIVEHRKAVVRVKKVSDNRAETKGKTVPSYFYQVAGGKVDHFGMYVKQKSDYGLTFSTTFQSGSIGGTDLMLTYNLSRVMSKGIKMNAKPGLHIYGELGFNSGNYNDVLYGGSTKYNFTRASFGLIQEYYFWHYFQLAGKIGYGSESTELTGNSAEEDKIKMAGSFLLFGGRFGINLMHNLQLVTGINVYAPFGKASLTYGTQDPVDDVNNWTYYFYDRKGSSSYFGLKIIF